MFDKKLLNHRLEVALSNVEFHERIRDNKRRGDRKLQTLLVLEHKLVVKFLLQLIKELDNK